MTKALLAILFALFTTAAQAQHIGFGNIVPIGTNTVMGNSTSATASMAALSVGGCSSATSALKWTTNTGFGCNTSINAATLGGATFAAPGAIGSGTPSTGSFTTGTFNADSVGVASAQISVKGASNSNQQLLIGYDTTNNVGIIQSVFQSTAYEPLNLNPNGGVVNVGAGLSATGAISATTTTKTGGYTVATLPAGIVGMHAYVTDATAPTFLGLLVGGGTVTTPVFYNGTAWVSD